MTIQSFAQLFSVLTGLVFAVRWLLSFYFKKSNELEGLKAENRAAADAQMKSNLDELRATVKAFQLELGQIREKMAEYAGGLRESSRMMDALQKQFEKATDRLEERYRALDGAEVVQVGKNTFIFKTAGSKR